MFPAIKLHPLREQLSLSHDNVYDFAVFSVSTWSYQVCVTRQRENCAVIFSSNPPKQWQSKRHQVSGHYLIYRFTVAALFLSVVTYCGSRSNHPEYWLIYLSHIGLILQTLHLVISAAVPVQLLLLPGRGNLYFLLSRGKECNVTLYIFYLPLSDGIENSMPLLARFSWFLYNVTNLLSLVISVVFWAVLFTPG